MSSFLGAPVQAMGKVYGNIYLTEKRSAPEFSEEDEESLVILATQAGVAIANATLYAADPPARTMAGRPAGTSRGASSRAPTPTRCLQQSPSTRETWPTPTRRRSSRPARAPGQLVVAAAVGAHAEPGSRAVRPGGEVHLGRRDEIRPAARHGCRRISSRRLPAHPPPREESGPPSSCRFESAATPPAP